MRPRIYLFIGVGLLAAATALGIAGTIVTTGVVGGGRQTVTIGQAQQAAQEFVDQTGVRGLELDEILEFQNNFYVRVKETSTDVCAFELLVDRSSRAVSYEPGPNMMWNTKYGPMAGGHGGMMGGWAHESGPMTVDAEQATAIAQAWLDQHGSGYAAGSPDSFYGYYTFDYQRNGRIQGMLSVNGYTGQVWHHSWHGSFVTSKELTTA